MQPPKSNVEKAQDSHLKHTCQTDPVQNIRLAFRIPIITTPLDLGPDFFSPPVGG